VAGGSFASGQIDSVGNGWMAFATSHGPGAARFFPQMVVAHLVKLACALPDEARRSLSLWTCAELARTLVRDKVVESISPQSVQRILLSYRLKPWRVHYWLNAKGPRDEEFLRQTNAICDLYTRELEANERVFCVDEKTSLQPRTRTRATLPAKPSNTPREAGTRIQAERGAATVRSVRHPIGNGYRSLSEEEVSGGLHRSA
jgi:hypothetical protein